MLRFNSNNRSCFQLELVALESTRLPSVSGIREIADSDPDLFMKEVNPDHCFLGSGFTIGATGHSGFDFLCAGRDGTVSVIAFEEDNGHEFFSALCSCARLSTWSAEKLVGQLSEGERSKLEAFLSGGLDSLNRKQAIVVLSSSQSPDLIAALDWLKTAGVAVSLVQLAVLREPDTDDLYIRVANAASEFEPVSIVKAVGRRDGVSGPDVGLPQTAGIESPGTGQAAGDIRILEERYRTIAELAPVGIFHTDADGEYEFVNERWCEIAGLPAEKALGRGWIDAVHPEDRDRVLSSWSRLLDSKQPIEEEFRFVRRDGLSWALVEAAVITDLAGSVAGVAGSATELHRTSSRRSESQDEVDSNSAASDSESDLSPSEVLECSVE